MSLRRPTRGETSPARRIFVKMACEEGERLQQRLDEAIKAAPMARRELHRSTMSPSQTRNEDRRLDARIEQAQKNLDVHRSFCRECGAIPKKRWRGDS
jgi:uncharacterized protein YicC (UPF0701 family)